MFRVLLRPRREKDRLTIYSARENAEAANVID
jgi:hypothetical protein